MKITTIRLNSSEMKTVNTLKKRYCIATINGAIRASLLDAERYEDIKQAIEQALRKEISIDREKAMQIVNKFNLNI